MRRPALVDLLAAIELAGRPEMRVSDGTPAEAAAPLVSLHPSDIPPSEDLLGRPASRAEDAVAGPSASRAPPVVRGAA
jgi:hypothetical protein